MKGISNFLFVLQIRAEYIGDFQPNEYMPVLIHKYLLIPDLELAETLSSIWKSHAKSFGLWQSIHNVSEWLLVGKEHFELSGYFCNKIGVSYTAFRNQGSACTRKVDE